VIRKILTRFVLFVLVISRPPLGAAQPALPPCKAAGDERIPVSTWSATLTKDGHLSSAPPLGNGRIVYFSLAADEGAIESNDSADIHSFVVPNEAPRLPELQVFMRGKVQVANGKIYFSGFYVNEPERNASRTCFRRIETLDVVLSGRYCSGDPPAGQPPVGVDICGL
jgi:hypothetical protein